MNPPQISVIVVSYNARATMECCLRALENQVTAARFETIVVDSSRDETADLVALKFPRARLMQFSTRKFPGSARNVGIRAARGEIIAFVDADCVADSRWIEQILRAHQSSDLVVGGAIANAAESNAIGWAAYFTEFTRWMPGQSSQWVEDIPAANISYKRGVFERFGFFIEGTYCADTELHWRLGRAGLRLRFAPEITVAHHSQTDGWKFLRHEFEHGRAFARVRTASKRWSVARRVLYAGTFALLAIKLFGAVVWRNLTNRIYLTRFAATLPLTFVGILAWSFGEAVGYTRR